MNATKSFEVPLSVDVVLLCLREGRLQVGLIERPQDAAEPFPGVLALPGGTIDKSGDVDTDVTVMRVLAQKAGVQVPYFEQLRLFSGAKRDPRGWTAALAHVALVPADLVGQGRGCATDDTDDTGGALAWRDVDALPRMAFDHALMVSEAVTRVRNKTSYSTLPLYLMPAEFTLPDLQAVYEQLLGMPQDKRSFRRQMEAMDVLVPLGRRRAATSKGRPSELYQIKARAGLVQLPGAFAQG